MDIEQKDFAVKISVKNCGVVDSMSNDNVHCRVLMAEWLARFLNSLDLDLYDQFVSLPSTPHNLAFNILCDLGVCKRQSNLLAFKFITKPDKIRQKVEHNISKTDSFNVIFQVFMELARYFCDMEDRVNTPFSIHSDTVELFYSFEQIGFAKFLGAKVQWTKLVNEQTSNRFQQPHLKAVHKLDARSLKKRPFRYATG